MDGTSSSSVAMDTPKPCIGILSIGDMGLGITKLLRAHDYPVVTVASGRRQVPPFYSSRAPMLIYVKLVNDFPNQVREDYPLRE